MWSDGLLPTPRYRFIKSIKLRTKHTLIGIQDQTRVVADLPSASPMPETDKDASLKIGCTSGGVDCQSMSSSDANETPKRSKPLHWQGFRRNLSSTNDKAERGGFSGGTIQCYVDLL